MKKKIKKLTLEEANDICKNQLSKYSYSENACKNCELNLDDEYGNCGITLVRLIQNYGDKEVDVKENQL